jgi:hypothetical protein
LALNNWITPPTPTNIIVCFFFGGKFSQINDVGGQGVGVGAWKIMEIQGKISRGSIL